jgi:hypothetical protein
MEEQRSSGTGTGLGQHLRWHHAEREPGVRELVRKCLGSNATSFNDGVESDLLGVGDAYREVAEGSACVEVWDVYDVSLGAKPICE